MESVAALNKWSSELQAQIMPAYLKGLVEQTYYSLTAERTATWTAVERALTDRFNPKESRDFVPKAVFAYNTTVHESTGFTPYRLMFGMEAILPLDALLRLETTPSQRVGSDIPRLCR